MSLVDTILAQAFGLKPVWVKLFGILTIVFKVSTMISAPLKTIDAFAGIGGFALGLEGISQTVAFIEWDKEAQQVLMSS